MANDQFRPFADRPALYDRSNDPARERVDRVYFEEGAYGQGADVNEAFSAEEAARTRVGNLIAADGDRISGADIVVERVGSAPTGTVILAAGDLYVLGDRRSVPAASLADVPMVDEVRIGVRVTTTKVTAEEDPTLEGLHPGTDAHGEPGAVRTRRTLAWAWNGDGGEGQFFTVYLLSDGNIVDQAPPPNLTGVAAVVKDYDYQALGNYIARGCLVTALGDDGEGNQVFSIAAGVANILGYKRTREVSTRYVREEDPDILQIEAEPHVYADSGGGAAIITVNRPPIAGVQSVLVAKRVTETIVRGSPANSSDLLSNSSVYLIESVMQGGSPIASGWALSADRVEWAGAGPEPSVGSSYQVTYLHYAPVTATELTARTFKVAGGVVGQPVLVKYTAKRPRYDRICFDKDGMVAYIKGTPSDDQPQPPATPETLLSLAVIKNDWFGAPVVDNDGTRSIPFHTQWKYFNKVLDTVDLVALERLRRDIDSREPVAKAGVFVDPLTSDRYRDAGEAQTGAVFNGTLQLAIDPTFHEINLDGPSFLPFTETTVIVQDFVTGCMKINPYQNFTPPALAMTISPARDFWTDTRNDSLSPVTQVFGFGNTSRVVSVDVLSTSTIAQARFLRQISVSFTIRGMGEGETLTSLMFDGVDVTPPGLEADANGELSGSFTIPANVTSGSKLVYAETGSERVAGAQFVGEGRIETIVRQQVTTIEQWQVDPPAIATPALLVDWFGGDGTGSGAPGGNSPDPLAQSFSLRQPQHVSAVSVRFCNIGNRANPVICEIVTMENGFPSTTVVAQAVVDMQAVLLNTWQRFAFSVPVFLPSDRQFAFVFKTDDPDHSLSISRRGGFDVTLQQFVAAQPYTVGVLFSSSNAITWTAHQDEDLAFRVHAARFNPTTRVVSLGEVAAVNLTDAMVEASVFLPTADARVLFEIQPAGEPAVRVEPGQVWERAEAFTGSVALRAILTGSELISPVLGRDFLAIFGTIRESATYISRLFTVGDDMRVNVVGKTRIPVGGTIQVEFAPDGGAWATLPQSSAEVLVDGTLERTFTDDGLTADEGRIRITLTGGAGARVALSDLRAWARP